MREGASPGNGAGKLFSRYGFVLYLYKQEIETLQLPHGMKIYPPEFPMRDSLAALAGCVECLFVRSACVLVVYFLRTPSRVPYGTPSACANRAAYPAPPPVVPHPESIDAQAAYRGRHSVTVVPKLDIKLVNVNATCLITKKKSILVVPISIIYHRFAVLW